MTDTKENNNVPRSGKRWKKWVLFGLLAVVFFFLSLLLVFKERILESIIKEAIYAESQGRYSIHFDKLDYRFTDNSILFLDFSLKGDTARLMDSKGAVFEVLIDSVKLNRISFLKLYRKQVLDLSSIMISKPIIKIFKTDTSHVNKPHEELQSALLEGMQKFFLRTEVGLVNITDGQMKVFGFSADTIAAYSIKSFDVSLYNFLIGDSTIDRKKKVFFSDNLDIVLHAFKRNLNSHMLGIEHVRLSTASQSIHLEGLRLDPDNGAEDVKVSLNIPWSEIVGFKLSALLYEGKLELDTILLRKPDLKIFGMLENTQTSAASFSNADLFDALPEGIARFGLQHLLLKDANLEVENSGAGKSEYLQLGSLNVSLSGILVDSGIVGQARDSLLKGDLLVSSEQAVYRNGSGTFFRSGSFNYSLLNKRFSMHDFQFTDPGEKQDSLILAIPSLKITGVSLWKMMAGDFAGMKELEVENAEVFKVLQISQQNVSEELVLPALSLASLNAGNTNIHLAFKDSSKLTGRLRGSFDFILHQLKLDTILPLGLQQPQFVVLNTGELLWEDFQKKNHVRASILFDSRKELLLFENVSVHSGDTQEAQKKIEIREFSFPAFEISSFDYWDLLQNNQFEIDRASLRQAGIGLIVHKGQGTSNTHELHKDLHKQLTTFLGLIRMKQFDIQDLEIIILGNEEVATDLRLAGIDASFRQVSLDSIFDHEKAGFFFAEDFDIQVSDLLLPIGIEDTIGIKKLYFSKNDQRIQVHEIRSMTAAGMDDHLKGPNPPGIFIPDIFLNGVDFDAFYLDSKFKVDSILVPGGKLSLQPLMQSQEPVKQVVAISAPAFAATYQIDNILIDKLDYDYPAKPTAPVSFQLSSHIKGLSFDSSLVFIPFETSLPLADFVIDLHHASFALDTNSALAFDSLSLNYAKRDMHAYGISFHERGGQTRNQLSVNSRGLYISDLDYKGFFEGEGLGIKSLDLDSCQINYTTTGTGSLHPAPRLKAFAKPLHKIKAGEVLFKNIELSLNNDNDSKALQLNNIRGKAQNILFDSISMHDQQKIFFAENIELSKPEYTLISSDSMYTFSFNSVSLSTAEKSISIGDIRIKPNYLKYEFSRKLGYQTDRMDVGFEGVSVREVDFKQIIERQYVKAGHIRVDNTNFEAFRDKRLPFPEWHTSPMPQDLIASLDFGLDIDTLVIAKARIVYGEMVDKSVDPGEIHFNEMNILLSNLTNDSLQISRDPVMGMKVRGRIMDKGDLNALLKLKLNHPTDTFAFHASLSKMDLSEFNSLSVNLFGVEIKSGNGAVDTLNIFGNSDYAIGQLYFPYRKFKIKMINRQKGNRGGIGDGILTFLANNILLKSNNRRLGRPVRIGQIFYQRDPQKSIFNYLWKGVLSGVESSMGYNTREQKKEMKEYKEKLGGSE
ncbi:MAG: hypothetical protein U5Q03_02350 [Bacteroidota bacterium]|nr:hypothetical protein [Bacteroidota bacterium]